LPWYFLIADLTPSGEQAAAHAAAVLSAIVFNWCDTIYNFSQKSAADFAGNCLISLQSVSK
jgi:hypothetical protein